MYGRDRCWYFRLFIDQRAYAEDWLRNENSGARKRVDGGWLKAHEAFAEVMVTDLRRMAGDDVTELPMLVLGPACVQSVAFCGIDPACHVGWGFAYCCVRHRSNIGPAACRAMEPSTNWIWAAWARCCRHVRIFGCRPVRRRVHQSCQNHRERRSASGKDMDPPSILCR